ncbi:carbonic anhydrase family protein [Vibrio sp.]|uniref:Carbonic anhydrase n=1 Tax=Vibrio viridaestus TaxID=2487322 RepID=A0A3N9TL64_9VIBR|nr:carbonic anhydrase family protein [Vibrio viridaestus]MDC0611868.1 carbonic anhydrase family protein [Vibrio sp.]RQW64861.1 carbonic anhydrase [Vibrio viridaestus]
MKKLLVALSVSALLGGVAQASDWGYEGEHGPAHWGSVSKTCAEGVNQSPIDITRVAQSQLEPLNIHYTGKVTALTNNGHTLQATVTGDNTLTIDGDVFELKQFHFHTPSENFINHHQYALEAHFVHADKDGNLAVVAVMYDAGSDDADLDKLTAKIPSVNETQTLATSFDVKEMLPTSVAKYYRFNGSLTTPPCSEGVRWFVIKQHKTLSSDQEKAFSSVMGHNNRPLQGLHARIADAN